MAEQVLHKGLTSERWNQFPLDKRLAMIASEFGRAISALERDDRVHAGECYQRARELVVWTLRDFNPEYQGSVLSLLRGVERAIETTNIDAMPFPQLLEQSQQLDEQLSAASWALHDGNSYRVPKGLGG